MLFHTFSVKSLHHPGFLVSSLLLLTLVVLLSPHKAHVHDVALDPSSRISSLAGRMILMRAKKSAQHLKVHVHCLLCVGRSAWFSSSSISGSSCEMISLRCSLVSLPSYSINGKMLW